MKTLKTRRLLRWERISGAGGSCTYGADVPGVGVLVRHEQEGEGTNYDSDVSVGTSMVLLPGVSLEDVAPTQVMVACENGDPDCGDPDCEVEHGQAPDAPRPWPTAVRFDQASVLLDDDGDLPGGQISWRGLGVGTWYRVARALEASTGLFFMLVNDKGDLVPCPASFVVAHRGLLVSSVVEREVTLLEADDNWGTRLFHGIDPGNLYPVDDQDDERLSVAYPEGYSVWCPREWFQDVKD